ncbi:MAG: histidinol-phosphatase [Candidatus Zixiibacteriota bacterium]
MPEPTITPLAIEGLSDHHCHCDYSVDAVGTIDDYCQAALKRNLAEICFTTHYDANPQTIDEAGFISVNGERVRVGIEPLNFYAADVERAREKYYPLGLSVLLGLEFGWYPGCEEEALKVKRSFPFDYFLVGVHEIDDICYCCSDTYEKCFSRFGIEEMAEKYFAQVIDAAKSGVFNTIAHLDYYRKYGEKVYGAKVHQIHKPYLEDLFDVLKASGTGIEVNTAARRKGLDSYFPLVETVNLAKRAGVDVLFLGSDAHAPEQVGYDFETASSLVPSSVTGCED